MSTATPSDDEVMAFLRLMATTLRTGMENYMSFLDDLIEWMGPINDTRIVPPEGARSEAIAAAATLAQLSRNAEAAVALLGPTHGASPHITAGLPLLRALGDSYAMVAGATSIAELDDMPLALPEEIDALRARAEGFMSRWAVPLDQLT